MIKCKLLTSRNAKFTQEIVNTRFYWYDNILYSDKHFLYICTVIDARAIAEANT